MPLVTLPRFLLRAPLLPLSALDDPVRALLADPIGRRAADSVPADALPRYARRAAFRPTPRGAWAGICTGELAARTSIKTGKMSLDENASWAAVARRARELLDDPDRRRATKVRRAPSLLLRGDGCIWLVATDEGAEQREAEVDELLGAVLDATARWTLWPTQFDDDYLLGLVDDGLLHTSLTPPLWPIHESWLQTRAGQEVTADLPRDQLLLVHDCAPRLSRRGVERAAAIAPLLFRLQDALSPPARERDLDADLLKTIDAIVETFGAGAIDLAALALGDYGLRPPAGPIPPRPFAPPPALVSLLVEAFARGGEEVALDPDALDAVLPAAEPPPSFELFLTPTTSDRGTGWLLGTHAPAGASLGRFGAHVMGEISDLRDVMAQAYPDCRFVSLSYAPTPATADLATNGPIDGKLALTHWYHAPADELTPADLRLVAGDGPLRLVDREGRTVVPSPLSRIRSTTAPRGVYQLLAGWSLVRQHAPWAFAGGPLANLSRTPRVVIDGFVVAPRSWSVPADIGARGRLKAWRRSGDVPRHIQIGLEDELMLVDLEQKGAAGEIAKLAKDGARAWEVWPPLEEVVDKGGRRVEAVVSVVNVPEPAASPRRAFPVDPPRPNAWKTLELYGDELRQDRVLLGAVAPAIADARAAGELDAWFFLRYVDPLGRPHLRVRLRGRGAAEKRLRLALAPAVAAADVVDIRLAPYHREEARYGGAAALDAWEKLFEADSDLVLEELEHQGPDGDPVVAIVNALDSLTRALGLGDDDRHALARRLRDATGHDDRDDYRRLQRALADLRPRPYPRMPPPSDALAAVLHMTVNRRDPRAEARAYYLWERALDSLRARQRRR